MSIATQKIATAPTLDFPSASGKSADGAYTPEVLGLFTQYPGLRQKVEKAAQKNAEFEWLVRTLAYKLGLPKGSILMGPMKSVGTIVNKADRKFNGDIHQVLDDNRATIILEKADQVDKVMTILRKAKDGQLMCIADKVKVDQLKNTFGDSAYKGFETVKANFYLDDVPTEIQFRYPCNEKAYRESHHHYERERACELALKSFGERASIQSGDITPEQQADMILMLHKMGARAGRKREAANERAFGRSHS